MTSSLDPVSTTTGDTLTDLTLINGIGPSRQQMLRDLLAIESIADLAAHSAADLEARLKAADQHIPRSQIKAWIDQARSLVAESAETGDDWQAIQAFVVTFEEKTGGQRRVRVRHEATGTEQIWHGQNIRAAATWMTQFADKPRQPAAPRVTLNPAMQSLLDKVENLQANPAAVQPPVPTVKITRVRAFQPPQQALPVGLIPGAQLSPGIIKADQLFRLETEFTVSGLAALDDSQLPQRYNAQFFVVDRGLGTVLSLGSSPVYAFTPGQATYTVTLDEVVLRAGTYRLEVVTRLERQSGAWMGYLEVPILQIV